MHDITQLWGMCIIGKKKNTTEFLLESSWFPDEPHSVHYLLVCSQYRLGVNLFSCDKNYKIVAIAEKAEKE